MGTNISLDMLQNSGIIAFDAEAYLKGSTPQANTTAIQTQTNSRKELNNDIYIATKPNKYPAAWKKYLAAGLAASLALFLILRGKLNPKNWKIFNKTV